MSVVSGTLPSKGFIRRRGKKTKELVKKAEQLKPRTVRHAEDMLVKELVKTSKKANTLQRRLGSEYRFQDVTFTASSITSAGGFQLMNGLVLGDTNGTREGTNITLKSFELCGTFNLGDTINVVRFILLVDSQANAAGPAVADVLAQVSTNTTYNWQNRSRFRILIDKMYDLSTDRPQISVNYRKFLRVRTNYNTSNAGTVADIVKNSLYILFISDSGAAPHPFFDGVARIVYSP